MLLVGVFFKIILLIFGGDASMGQFPGGHELLEELVAVAAEVGDVVDGDVQEPDHDIVALLVDQQPDVDPVAHHRRPHHQHYSSQAPQRPQIEGSRPRVVEKGGEDGCDVVGEDGGDREGRGWLLEVAEKAGVKQHHCVLEVTCHCQVVLQLQVDNDICLEGHLMSRIGLIECGIVGGGVDCGHDVLGEEGVFSASLCDLMDVGGDDIDLGRGEEQFQSVEGEEEEEKEAGGPPQVHHLHVIEIGVDGRSQLGLVSFVVELEQFALVLAISMTSGVRVVAFHAFRVHHLDLVVQQPHRLDLLPEDKPLLHILLLLLLRQPPHEVLDGAAVLVQFQYALVDGFARPLACRLLRKGLSLFAMCMFIAGDAHSEPDVFLAGHHHTLLLVFCVSALPVDTRCERLHLHQALPPSLPHPQVRRGAVRPSELWISEV